MKNELPVTDGEVAQEFLVETRRYEWYNQNVKDMGKSRRI